MNQEFIFKDSSGHVLCPEEILDMSSKRVIRAYTRTASKRIEKIGTYTKKEILKKFL